MTRACATCTSYHPHCPTEGRCKAGLPTAGENERATWPIVAAHEWCAQYSPNSVRLDPERLPAVMGESRLAG